MSKYIMLSFHRPETITSLVIHQKCFFSKVSEQLLSSDLIAIDHQMVCGCEGLEDNHPAGVRGPLKQCVSQLRDVHIHLICALNQV